MVRPEEAGLWGGEILQISVYRGQEDAMRVVRSCAEACESAGIPHVLHPVGYGLLGPSSLERLKPMAEFAGEALILHDERGPSGGRLEGGYAEQYGNALKELGALVPVSLENATFTGDVRWFWDAFAASVTLDLGHVEAAGLDSVEFVRTLEPATVEKVRYVHMHRNGPLRGGITDHWPLSAGCRELRALGEFLRRKKDVAVILEINETRETAESMRLLESLREEVLPLRESG